MNPPSTRRRPALPAVLVGVLAVLLGLVLAAAAGVYALTERIGRSIERVDGAFAGLEEIGRPAPTAATTFLVVGTDSRSDGPGTGTGAVADGGPARSDAVMVVRLAADGRSAAVVSIPRDSWVDVPGLGPAKINAAYAHGGSSLLVRTVEQLTGIRIDHFGVIDFAGFREMVDAVGGIDVEVAEPTASRGVVFTAGRNHLDGAQALVYVRQRYGLPDGDLDRARRQQEALRALLVSAGDRLSDPVGLLELVDATSRTVSLDDSLTNDGLRELALHLSGLRPDAVRFASAPVAGAGREGGQSVLHLDAAAGRELWASVADGTLVDRGGGPAR
jgi:LCP family protein required for cell wall assembly